MKEKREGLGLSLREASKLSGVSHTHIRDIETGKSVPSFEMVMKFLRAYGVATEVFLRETGYLSSHGEPECLGAVKRVPVISWAQAGTWQELCANFQYGGHEEYVETDSKGVFALKVRGDSMETEFREGDIIVINPYLKPEHNDYVVIANDEGEATFKQLKKYGKTRVLHPLNPKYDDMELNKPLTNRIFVKGKDIEYRIVGVVMEKKKRYR